MNTIREIERLNQRELDLGIPLSASWHNDWSDTAYIYIGGLPYELSEGDIITIFSQYGEPVHVNLIRDKDTGKSKGFAFLKYEDQRSTALAVDNLGGAVVMGRTLRVDHTRYKPKEGDGLEEGQEQDGPDKKRTKRSESPAEDKRAPTPEPLLPEEIELQKLIRDHDDDDPMKDYLVREKQKEVKEARARRDQEMKSSRKDRRKDDDRKSRSYRSHRHRSRSTTPPGRKHRDRSNDRSHRHRPRSKSPNGKEKEHEHRKRHHRERENTEDERRSGRDRGEPRHRRHDRHQEERRRSRSR